jgi:myo-inositol 2-dehydrogenase / D-chiro-inositol 1-dehydrogenase
VKNSNHHNQDHSRNFLNCIKSRQTPISDIEIGHRSTSAAQLGNIALRSKSTVVWDRASEKIRSNKEAARYLVPKYRRPWKLS